MGRVRGQEEKTTRKLVEMCFFSSVGKVTGTKTVHKLTYIAARSEKTLRPQAVVGAIEQALSSMAGETSFSLVLQALE